MQDKEQQKHRAKNGGYMKKSMEIALTPLLGLLLVLGQIIICVFGNYKVNLTSMFLFIVLSTISTALVWLLCNSKVNRNRVWHFSAVIILVAIDQLVKLVVSRSSLFELTIIRNGLVLKPSHNINHSAFFSLLGIEAPIVVSVIMKILSLILVVSALVYFKRKNGIHKYNKYVIVLIVAGICCALLDDIIWGYTLDFICFPLFTVIDIKDIYLFVGLNLYMISAVSADMDKK